MALKQVSPTDEFIKGLWRDNPVFIQMLGLCPALAVSNTAINALAMGAATTFVLLMAGLSVSLLRNFIPREARIVSYICIIATFVTCVDYAIMAISIELHRALGAFIALIVVNCLILGRSEAFASKNKPGRALLDALGMVPRKMEMIAGGASFAPSRWSLPAPAIDARSRSACRSTARMTVGAIISMTVSPSGNCIGNGTGDVLFSSEALIDASIDAAGGGNGMRVLSWID